MRQNEIIFRIENKPVDKSLIVLDGMIKKGGTLASIINCNNFVTLPSKK